MPKANKIPRKSKEPKLEDTTMDGIEMSGDKYFGKHRIIDETELSFHCHATENGEVSTWLGGFKWKFVKHGKGKVSLMCEHSWKKDSIALVDLHFYCLPDKDSNLPMTSCTIKQRKLETGIEVEGSDEILRFNCRATYGVYVRLLKKWDDAKRPWNSRKTKHTLKYVVRGREFYVLEDFMASISGFIKDFLDKMDEDDSKALTINHDPHEFDVFLHAIDGQDPVLPAPDTIRFLIMFADDYSIPSLMAKCEKHLKYCHEIPLFERLKIASDYGMKDTQNYLMDMVTNSEWTRAKMGGDRKEFDELVEAVPNFYEWIFDREHLC